MQQFDFTAPAGKPQRISAPGKYIKYLSGSNGGGDASLVLTPGGHGSSKIILQVGQAYRVAADGQTPDSWTITNNAGGAPIIGKLVIGNGQIDDPTIAGTVQVIDGGKARSLANSAFMAYGVSSAVAAQWGRVMLWNPATNPNRVILEAGTLLAAATAIVAALDFMTVALGNVGENGISKCSGGPSSAAYITYDTTASASALPVLKAMACGANVSQDFKLVEPLVLLPGSGLVIYSSTQNAFVGASFEWYEEPNV